MSGIWIADTPNLRQTRLTEEEEEKIHVTNTLSLTYAQVLAFKALTLMDAHLSPIEIVGSIRRQKAVCKDIDFVGMGTVKDLQNAVVNVVGLLDGKVKAQGDQIARILIPYKVRDVYAQLDIYRATEENYGVQKLIRTGSAEHNIWLAKRAIRQGKRLLYSKGVIEKGKVIASAQEKDVFEALGLDYILPPEREVVNGIPVWMKK